MTTAGLPQTSQGGVSGSASMPEFGTSIAKRPTGNAKRRNVCHGFRGLSFGQASFIIRAMPTPDHDLSDVRSSLNGGWLGRVVMIIAWVALALQLVLSLQAANADGRSIAAGLMTYFGYYTIWTTLFVALALTIPTAGGHTRVQRFFAHPQTLGCVVTSTILVGLGYHFLLRQVWNPAGLQWFLDLLLHYVVPAGFLLYWFHVTPKSSLPWWSPLAWSLYPFFYFCYVLLRGALIGTYPYPFIDVASIGFLTATRNAFALILVFVVAGGFLLAINRAANSR